MALALRLVLWFTGYAHKRCDGGGLYGSANMVEAARNTLRCPNSELIHTALEDWTGPASYYDLVVSRLVLHYIEDVDALLAKIFRTLAAGGELVFSMEHPVMTSSYGLPGQEGLKQDWTVDRYFHTGIRRQEWLGGTAIKYHRTIEDIFTALQQSGFCVEQIKESRPDITRFQNRETYLRRMRIPLFLLIKAKKRD